MGSVNAANADRLAQLTEISKMAFGAGTIESHRGGKGNIGLINGQVVKFNTHLNERLKADNPRITNGDDVAWKHHELFNTTKDWKTNDDIITEQHKSCQQLRETLANIANDLIKPGSDSPAKQKVMTEIKHKLGIGRTRVELLDRKAVASVVKIIAKYSPDAERAVADGRQVAADQSMRSSNRTFADKYRVAIAKSSGSPGAKDLPSV